MIRIPFALSSALFVVSIAGCQAPANALDPGQVLGRDHVIGEPGPIPAGHQPSGGGDPGPQSLVGDSCHSDDINHICLALKYVVYRDSSEAPVISQDQAVNNVRSFNQVWGQCNIGFQIEQYLPIRPTDYQLSYQTASYPELDEIRQAFADDSSLLIVTTGTWDRTGSLGNTGANAWTSMPGGGPYGAILERPVGTFGNIIGHELGHYLNLMHVNDKTDLMNPIIYSNSTKLNPGQCDTARAAAGYFWSKMYR